MKQQDFHHDTWLELSAAAEYLGVHYTTLRRWADAGEISCIRTPGGRRRFALKALVQFVKDLEQSQPTGLALPSEARPMLERAVDYTRQSVQQLPAQENWLSKMNDAQRQHLRGTGNHLLALLLQYNSRNDSGEVFLSEGRRIAGEYSRVCSQVGLSLTETVHIFLFFRRSILSGIYGTGYLGGNEDYEGQRLFQRTSEFLDTLLLSLIDSYLSGLSSPGADQSTLISE